MMILTGQNLIWSVIKMIKNKSLIKKSDVKQSLIDDMVAYIRDGENTYYFSDLYLGQYTTIKCNGKTIPFGVPLRKVVINKYKPLVEARVKEATEYFQERGDAILHILKEAGIPMSHPNIVFAYDDIFSDLDQITYSVYATKTYNNRYFTMRLINISVEYIPDDRQYAVTVSAGTISPDNFEVEKRFKTLNEEKIIKFVKKNIEKAIDYLKKEYIKEKERKEREKRINAIIGKIKARALNYGYTVMKSRYGLLILNDDTIVGHITFSEKDPEHIDELTLHNKVDDTFLYHLNSMLQEQKD